MVSLVYSFSVEAISNFKPNLSHNFFDRYSPIPVAFALFLFEPVKPFSNTRDKSDASVYICGGSPATEYETAHAYRLGAFQLVREWLDTLPLQLHNHTDSDWCLCIGRFSVLPLLLRQFQEAPAPSKAGKNDTGK